MQAGALAGREEVIRSKHSIHIDRPVHEVFDYLRNHENPIDWQGNLIEHEHERLERRFWPHQPTHAHREGIP